MSLPPLEVMQRYGYREALPGDQVDTSLWGFKLRTPPIPHRRFREGMCRIAELHHGRRTYQVGGGLLLIGSSGIGKSTLIESYESLYPRVHGPEGTTIPVLRVSVPSSPSAKSLAEAILVALKDPKAHRGSAAEKTERIAVWLERCGVELLLLDEFKHLVYTPALSGFRVV